MKVRHLHGVLHRVICPAIPVLCREAFVSVAPKEAPTLPVRADKLLVHDPFSLVGPRGYGPPKRKPVALGLAGK